jgi:hypothetical protein
MQKTIDALLQPGHIAPDHTSPWGFHSMLALEQHQEDVTDIKEYVWRFCINYILKLSPASAVKTAFCTHNWWKYIYLVVPFGIHNAPTLLLAMMHNLKWNEIIPSENKGTTITIMDDTFVFAVCEDNMFIILLCVCIITCKYNLTWKLKKYWWFPSKVKFVGVDIHKHGNALASSKIQKAHDN